MTLKLLLASAALAAPLAAPAQTVPAQSSEAEEPAPTTDIVVTARRRTESLQDVPIAVSVVEAGAIEATGNFNVNKLQQLTPTLQFYSSNPRNSAANIRGLGAPFGLTNDGIEQGVGLYVDQVYYSRIASASFDFLDVDRIEILRGPQGTLYGKNTTAGAINITTRPPSFDLEGRAELTYGNLDFIQAKASVSGPLSDTVAARIAVSASDRRGTLFNVATDRYINEIENLGVRGQVLWKASDTVSLTFAGDFNVQDPECCGLLFVRTGLTQRPINRQFDSLARAQNYDVPSRDPFDRLTDLDSSLRARNEIGGASLRTEWDVGPGVITSISAYRYWDWKPENDRDFIGLPITTVSANPSQQEQFTQELRFASTGENRLDYVIGLFGFYQTIDTQGAQEQGPAASRFLLNPGALVPPGAPGCATPTTAACNPAVLAGLRSVNNITFENYSAAAFGQLTFRLTDALTIQPGARINYDKKDARYVATVFTGSGGTTLNADQRGVLAPQSYAPEFSDWNFSYDLTVSYDIADDVLAYATYAKTFKSGGLNLAGLPLDAANNPLLATATVRPEKVDHYEVGLKTQLFGRRATLNLAAFRTDIEDYQATVFNGQLGVLRGYLANAEKVRTQGVEFDFAARPSDRLSLYLGGAYTDATYERFVDAPCPPELSGGAAATAANPASPPGTPGGFSPANCDISGQRLPGISKWAFSGGGEVNVPVTLFREAGAVYFGVDASYRSRFSSNPSRSIYTDIDGYGLANFRLGARTDSGWNAFVWLRNAFDEEYFELLALQSGNTGLVVGQPGDPQTYGLTVARRF